jgi:hypothetical protein
MRNFALVRVSTRFLLSVSLHTNPQHIMMPTSLDNDAAPRRGAIVSRVLASKKNWMADPNPELTYLWWAKREEGCPSAIASLDKIRLVCPNFKLRFNPTVPLTPGGGNRSVSIITPTGY